MIYHNFLKNLKKVWEILYKKKKRFKINFITTHFMNKVDRITGRKIFLIMNYIFDILFKGVENLFSYGCNN